jgi:hypothetical protein
VAVKDNELVHAGQLLVRLDDRDTRAAADHAQAVLEQRGATLTSLQAKYELQQSMIEQANADVDAKTAQAGFAKVDAERYHTLALSNYGSRQDAERTFALDAQARAAVSSAQAALAAAKQQLSVLNAEIAEASADMSWTPSPNSSSSRACNSCKRSLPARLATRVSSRRSICTPSQPKKVVWYLRARRHKRFITRSAPCMAATPRAFSPTGRAAA